MPKINLKDALKAGATAKLNDAISGTGLSVGSDGSISGSFRKLVKDKVAGNAVQSPLKDLYEDAHERTFKYPMDIDNDHYMIISPVVRSRTQRGQPSDVTPIAHIVLPVPSNLMSSYGAQYSSSSLGALGAMATGEVQLGDIKSSLESAGAALTQVGKDTLDAFEGKGQSEGLGKALNVATAAAAAGAVTTLGGSVGGVVGAALAGAGTFDNVVNGLGVATGVALNPHLATVFDGVGFRDHSFTYKFVARSEEESRNINSIILELKKNMLPSYQAGRLAFKYPNEFQIEFAQSIQPYLYHIGRCVLKDLQVNYNGEGIPLFFDETQAPVSIEIQMTFQEVQIVTRETIEEREKNYATLENDVGISAGQASSGAQESAGPVNAMNSDSQIKDLVDAGQEALGAASDMVDNAISDLQDYGTQVGQSVSNFFKV